MRSNREKRKRRGKLKESEKDNCNLSFYLLDEKVGDLDKRFDEKAVTLLGSFWPVN